jgi:VWFA-related protein
MRPILVPSFSLFAWVVVTTAQTPPRPQNPPTFVGGVDVVKLDVSVYDKDHRPIRGLTAADFTLLEDKLPRPIVGFAEVDIPEPPVPTATWMRDAPDDVATNDVADKRLFLLVIDDHSFNQRSAARTITGSTSGSSVTEFDPPQSLSYKVNRDALIVAARTFISHLGPTDLAAVVFVDDGRFNQDFTPDHGRVIAAVEKTLKEEPLYNPFGDAIPVLNQVVNSLIGVPAKRKAVVDITNAVGCLTGPELASADGVFQAAQRAGLRFYMMRPSGHVEICKGAYGRPLSTADLSFAAQDAAFLTRAPLETGGEAFLGVAKPEVAAAAAERIFEANSSYYMLGYTSADLEKIHFVKVDVNRSGAEVRTRPRYYPPKHEPAPTGPPPPATLAAIADVLPKSDVPLRATVAPFAAAAGPAMAPASGASVAVVIQVRQVRPEHQTGPIRESIDLRAAAFTSEGAPRGTTTRTIDVRLPAGSGDVDYEILQRIDFAKPGLYELRLSTHSGARKADGSVYITVDVPDFAKEALSLSGIVLGADNGLAIDGAELLKALLPVTPTTVRTFDRGEPVTAFLRAYEGGTSALRAFAIHTRIVDDHDHAVLDRTETIGPDRFDRSRASQMFVRLPTGDLAPGPYLLTLDATLGKVTARREMRFGVR